MTMHKILLATLMLLLAACTGCAGDKPEPAWSTFDKGILGAKAKEKKVMIDVFTDWCGWCKKLDKEVYADAGVASYLNEEFVSIKLDAESNAKVTFQGKQMTEMELARSFGVTGYPSIIFLEPDGTNITLIPGFVPAEKFLPILRYIGDNHYKTTSWEEYEKKHISKD
jgi:thioredoxin-related protein